MTLSFLIAPEEQQFRLQSYLHDENRSREEYQILTVVPFGLDPAGNPF